MGKREMEALDEALSFLNENDIQVLNERDSKTLRVAFIQEALNSVRALLNMNGVYNVDLYDTEGIFNWGETNTRFINNRGNSIAIIILPVRMRTGTTYTYNTNAGNGNGSYSSSSSYTVDTSEVGRASQVISQNLNKIADDMKNRIGRNVSVKLGDAYESYDYGYCPTVIITLR